MMKKRFSTTTVGILFVLALLLGMQLNKLISGDSIFEQLTKFKEVLSYTEKFYVDEVDTPKLVESAINGLLSDLDPQDILKIQVERSHDIIKKADLMRTLNLYF